MEPVFPATLEGQTAAPNKLAGSKRTHAMRRVHTFPYDIIPKAPMYLACHHLFYCTGVWGLRSIITPLCDDYPSEVGHMAEDEADFGISSSNLFPGDKRRLGRIRRRTPFCLISRSLWFGGSHRAPSTQTRKRDLLCKAPYSRLPFSPC
jgi:hypothetical protein